MNTYNYSHHVYLKKNSGYIEPEKKNTHSLKHPLITARNKEGAYCI